MKLAFLFLDGDIIFQKWYNNISIKKILSWIINHISINKSISSRILRV